MGLFFSKKLDCGNNDQNQQDRINQENICPDHRVRFRQGRFPSGDQDKLIDEIYQDRYQGYPLYFGQVHIRKTSKDNLYSANSRSLISKCNKFQEYIRTLLCQIPEAGLHFLIKTQEHQKIQRHPKKEKYQGASIGPGPSNHLVKTRLLDKCIDDKGNQRPENQKQCGV